MPIQNREELQNILEEILGSDAVYYQEPPKTMRVYPCIIYHLKTVDDVKADNLNYGLFDYYDLTVIGKKPDNQIALVHKIMKTLSGSRYDRAWIVDNLYHDAIVVW